MDYQENGAEPGELLRMTAEIVSAFVGQNTLPMQQVPDLINTVYLTLTGLQGAPVAAPVEPARPAVPIKKSVTPEYIVCLEDGKKLKMLKRHLRSTYDMTPDEYRAKWGLPPDYPMVAPNYAAQRSEFAKKIGLGRGDTRSANRRG
ncbi:transcriptional regulator [Niveispirillum lacus]|uniref:Transcriptional regulator n=1 Tax=Niveispirillum lacus TaxID=1981099 RepID=A0A255YRK6_9PROT|nr:MucR family transcriptional regulator [Niveispirillum lacus]OYQ31344.1 transcriptional regulator [Niveispirillum lacus]